MAYSMLNQCILLYDYSEYTYIIDYILIITLLLRIFHYYLTICLYCSLCRHVQVTYCIRFIYFTYNAYVPIVMVYNNTLCKFLYI